MPRQFHSLPDHLREPHEIEVRGVWNLYVIGIGVVLIVGFVGGSLWMAWRMAWRLVAGAVH